MGVRAYVCHTQPQYYTAVETYNRCVKMIKKFPTVWEKCRKTAGGGIFGLTLYIVH